MMEDHLPKITYLFGAGASAQKLPTIKELPKRINDLESYVEHNYIYGDEETLEVNDFKFKKNDAKAYLLEGLRELYKFSFNHSTIDTYAKKLDLTSRSSEADELCFFLALFFNLEQKRVGVDLRYDTFLISILNSNAHSLPNNLKFLSWNYDLQMEMAHKSIIGRSDFHASYDLFNTNRRWLKKEEFTSLKINGSCNLKDHHDSLYPLISSISDTRIGQNDLDYIMQYGYSQIKWKKKFYKADVNIDFAWYKSLNFINEVSDIYDQTEILIVVGYSFPFFNREVDRTIIRKMNNLRKIYIQDCYPENIKSRFLSILPDWQKRKIEIIAVTDVTEFFLPPEL